MILKTMFSFPCSEYTSNNKHQPSNHFNHNFGRENIKPVKGPQPVSLDLDSGKAHNHKIQSIFGLSSDQGIVT